MNIFSDEAMVAVIADLRLTQAQIDDDCLAFEGDEEPGIQYTLACNDDGSGYASQTGDNSFTGAAYSFPHWGVTGVYRDSDLADLASGLIEQLRDLVPHEDDPTMNQHYLNAYRNASRARELDTRDQMVALERALNVARHYAALEWR